MHTEQQGARAYHFRRGAPTELRAAVTARHCGKQHGKGFRPSHRMRDGEGQNCDRIGRADQQRAPRIQTLDGTRIEQQPPTRRASSGPLRRPNSRHRRQVRTESWALRARRSARAVARHRRVCGRTRAQGSRTATAMAAKTGGNVAEDVDKSSTAPMKSPIRGSQASRTDRREAVATRPRAHHATRKQRDGE